MLMKRTIMEIFTMHKPFRPKPTTWFRPQNPIILSNLINTNQIYQIRKIKILWKKHHKKVQFMIKIRKIVFLKRIRLLIAIISQFHRKLTKNHKMIKFMMSNTSLRVMTNLSKWTLWNIHPWKRVNMENNHNSQDFKNQKISPKDNNSQRIKSKKIKLNQANFQGIVNIAKVN